jgi:hypothetical protein
VTDRVKVEGLTMLRATLAVAARRIRDMSDPHRKTATYVETRGRADAPHLTGRLAGSLRAASDGESAEVTSALPYANRTHWGYARYSQRPQPFLLDAVLDGETVIVNNYADEVDRVVGGIRGK